MKRERVSRLGWNPSGVETERYTYEREAKGGN